MHESAVAYFRELADLLTGMHVTDEFGNSLELDDAARAAADDLLAVRRTRRKVMLTGNGGSAAIVSHIQNDLCKAVGVRAMVFNEPALLSALANDEGYERVFEIPVALWAEPDDLLIAISSSGRSTSITRAVDEARGRGCRVMTLSGFSAANPLRTMGHLNFFVQSNSYGFVEMAHATLAHYISDRAMALVAAERGLPVA